MFIQVITAKVVDADGIQRQLGRWEAELRPGAEGFLGSTSGITADGRLIALARFESEAAAQRNSDRPEQGEWWAETEKMLDEVGFKDSVEVVTMGRGGSDDAGFVQVMRGRILDRAKMDQIRSQMAEMDNVLSAHRPDVIGSVIAVHGDDTYTDCVYFTSQAEARANENKELPAEAQAMFGDFMSAFEVTDYLDLADPWLR